MYISHYVCKYLTGEQEFKLLDEGFTFVFACETRITTKPQISLLEKTEKQLKLNPEFNTFLKGTVGVVLSDSPCKDGNA